MDFGIDEMQKMQIKLQNKYKDKWESICPETAAGLSQNSSCG